MIPRIIELPEFAAVPVPTEDLSFELGEKLWRDFSKQVAVEFPSPKTGWQWVLTNLGWVGYLPATPNLGIVLAPKVPVGNIFRMLEYAHDLRGLRFFDDLAGLNSIRDVFERLAVLLAKRILDRTRKGLHRSYSPRLGRLPYVRGRVDAAGAIKSPWQVGIPCQYSVHTADIDDNQLLAWTLERIVRSGVCSGDAQRTVRAAHRALHGTIEATPFRASDAVGRTYTRLNGDYATMHALCRFFLEHSGPTHEVGDHRMMPFMVDMAALFERFVAVWLSSHLPPHLGVQAQRPENIGEHGNVRFRIDLTVDDKLSGRTLYVLDTKYKRADKINPLDVAQVLAYAQLTGASGAALVYPEPVSAVPLDEYVGAVRLKTVSFDVGGNIVQSADQFLGEVLSALLNSEQSYARLPGIA